jgi:D-alanyl-D-alanine carboxypeptidase
MKTSARHTLITWGALIACLAIAISAAATTATTAPARAQTATLQQDLDKLVAAGAPGAILFVRDGNRTTPLTAGYGDVVHKTLMRADDHFKIASLTKTYTATVVLQLVQEGRLRLRDNVEHWLPKLVPNGREITVHMLLNHTSGLADFESDPRFLKPYLSGNLGYYWSPRQLVRIAVAHKPLFPPGKTTHEAYSNTNYVLLGLIVEKLTGRSLGAELQRRIFTPLHLTETSFPTKPVLKSPYAHGYMVLGKPPAIDVTGLSPSMSPASGAIVSTARDTADFYRALLTGRLLGSKLLKAMKTTISGGPHSDIQGQRYGYGIETFPTECGVAWGHNGALPGYVTFIYSSVDGQRQALLMVNHDAQTLPKTVPSLFFKLIAKAYCTTA